MRENYRLTYRVDLVFCIDVTGSMSPLIETVKQNVLNLYGDIVRSMSAKHKQIDDMRVRVIAFRDYLADGADAILASDFFELPAQAEELKACLVGLQAEGGGDIPEDGLEALAFAMKSAWNHDGQKHRHIITVYSDAPTHPIRFGESAPEYPKGMAKDFAELTDWWSCTAENGGVMDQNAKRLLVFAPDAECWNTISSSWDNTIHVKVNPDAGLSELDYRSILDTISNSI